MATAYVTIGPVATNPRSGDVPIFQGGASASETVTTSATSAQGNLTAAKDSDNATVFCETAVYATTGQNPTASAASGVFCPGNVLVAISLNAGDKVALIDV